MLCSWRKHGLEWGNSLQARKSTSEGLSWKTSTANIAEKHQLPTLPVAGEMRASIPAGTSGWNSIASTTLPRETKGVRRETYEVGKCKNEGWKTADEQKLWQCI